MQGDYKQQRDDRSLQLLNGEQARVLEQKLHVGMTKHLIDYQSRLLKLHYKYG
jgi:hypothetical protein